jgi:endonuclease/exonuclease/phosphatase family metal-dependent hydrolase
MPNALPPAPRPHRFELRHDLVPELPELAGIRRRRQLRRHPLYRALAPEIGRVLDGFEWDVALADPPPRPRLHPNRIRAAAWNVERGKRFSGVRAHLREDPILRDADLVLLNEVDIGMGRSDNRNVARELACDLGMNYVFANSHLVLAPGDAGERDHGRANTLSLHGNVLLTRFPVRDFEAVPCPEYKDKFHALEKRLGSKRALLCEVDLPDGPLLVAVVHLDPFAPPAHRARQMRRILRRIDARAPARVLLGGDLNTNTYDLGRKLGLAANIVHKFARFGVAGTVEQYMTPERVFERKLFRQLERFGYAVEGFNDRRGPTHYFDAQSPEVVRKALAFVPRRVWRWFRPKLDPWQGRIGMRLDWFAGRGLRPCAAHVVHAPTWHGEPVADHHPISVDLALGE